MSPFKAGVIGLVAAMVSPVVFFGLLWARSLVLDRWTKPKPTPALEPRVLTEGDRAWSDVHHSWWVALHGGNDVQGKWDALEKPLIGAYAHPPG